MLAWASFACCFSQAEAAIGGGGNGKSSSLLYFEAAAMVLGGTSALVICLSLGVIRTLPYPQFLCYTLPQSDSARCHGRFPPACFATPSGRRDTASIVQCVFSIAC